MDGLGGVVVIKTAEVANSNPAFADISQPGL